MGWHGSRGAGESASVQKDIQQGGEKSMYVTGRESVWDLVVTNSGDKILSVGNDFAIRVWERTAETLVLTDEREQEREAEADHEASQNVILQKW